MLPLSSGKAQPLFRQSQTNLEGTPIFVQLIEVLLTFITLSNDASSSLPCEYRFHWQGADSRRRFCVNSTMHQFIGVDEFIRNKTLISYNHKLKPFFYNTFFSLFFKFHGFGEFAATRKLNLNFSQSENVLLLCNRNFGLSFWFYSKIDC